MATKPSTLAEIKKLSWFPATIYPVRIGLAHTKKALHKVHKYCNYPMPELLKAGCAVRLTSTLGEDVLILYIDKTLDAVDTIAVIVHESVHIKQYIEDCIGIDKLDAESEAYLVDWIVRQTLNFRRNA